MCIQCMAGAMTAASAATGSRAWLAAQPWVGPRLLKRATVGLLAGGLLASSVVIGGSGPAQARPVAAHVASPAVVSTR